MTGLTRGAFIVIEGLDRTGKSTQCGLLAKALNSNNCPAKLLKFPDRTTTIGTMIDSYLKKSCDIDDRAIHLLFSANRWEASNKLTQDLKSGVTLIVDRYAYSGVAYSSAKPGMDIEWCKKSDVGLPKPDVVMYMKLPADVAERRSGFGDERSSKQIVFSGQNQRSFEFDHVADQDTTQSSVFSSVGRQIVESCVEGYNGTIFAYGQTGSGKTYTMLGPGEGQNADMDVKGLIPRSLDYLFELLNRKKAMHGQNFEYDCCASFLEIYNEQVYDLLDQFHTKSIALRESQIRGVYPEGIIERNVSNSYEAWNVLAEGWRNRRVSSTAMNRESSRSHAVFTLAVQTKEHSATGGITKVRQSVLNLVDLAGSERQKDTHSTGLQLREAGKINRSLSVLGQVIMALDDVGHGKQRFIPYRESKLTMLLRVRWSR